MNKKLHFEVPFRLDRNFLEPVPQSSKPLSIMVYLLSADPFSNNHVCPFHVRVRIKYDRI